jgi:serine/threonine-protein kinase
MSDLASPLSPRIGPGTTIADKYRIEKLIGVGGMGIVWKATQLDLDRPVAIKIVREDLPDQKVVGERAYHEARASARLRSEHVVRVLDLGRTDTGTPFIVLEYLEGRDLYDLLTTREAPLPVTEAVDVLLEACEGLAEAHALGIVHRDLKPENLFIARRPDGTACLKILDFGISKQLRIAGRALTTQSTAIGSPQYMSPEQMRGAHDIDQRADIWSLGATLYELLVGAPPFKADTIPSVCTLVLESDPIPPRSLRQGLPQGLEQVILKCLSKRREDRFQSVKELAEALLPFGNPASSDRALRIAHTLASSSWTMRQASHTDHLPHGSTITTPPEPKVSLRKHVGYWALGGVFLAAATCLALAANAAARQSREVASVTSPVVASLEPTVPHTEPAVAQNTEPATQNTEPAAQNIESAPAPSIAPAPLPRPLPRTSALRSSQRVRKAARRVEVSDEPASAPAPHPAPVLGRPAPPPSRVEEEADAWDRSSFGGRR